MFHALEAPRGQQLPMSPSGISDLGAACSLVFGENAALRMDWSWFHQLKLGFDFMTNHPKVGYFTISPANIHHNGVLFGLKQSSKMLQSSKMGRISSTMFGSVNGSWISWVYNGIQWIIMGYIWDIIRYSGMYNQQYDGSVWKRGMHTVKLECYCQYVERWWSAIKSWGTLFSDKIVSVAYLCVSPYMICTRKLYQLTVKHPIWEDRLVVRGQGELLCWIFRVILGWSSKELGNWAW